MNTRLHFLALASISAVTLFSVSTLVAQRETHAVDHNSPPSSSVERRSDSVVDADLTRGVYLSSPTAEDLNLGHYNGRRLVNTEGALLGHVEDFVVQPASGRIAYLVGSAGGIGGRIGEKLRLVPASAVVRDDRDGVVVNISSSGWLAVPPIDDRAFANNQLTYTVAQQRALEQAYGRGAAGEPRLIVSGDVITGLIRASALQGQVVVAGAQDVGKIDTLVFDLPHETCAAVVKTSGAFVGTKARYLVPLNRLAWSDPEQRFVSTTLTRADFDRAQPTDFGLRNRSDLAPVTRTTTPALAPTGPNTVRTDANPSGR